VRHRLLAVALAAVLAPALTACEGDVLRFTLVTGGTLELAAGETERATVVVAGGVLRVPTAARIEGAVVVIDGALSVAGRVDGDVTALAGRVDLEAGAVIAGDLRVAGDFERHPQARVEGVMTLGAAVPAELADAVRGPRAGLLATLLRVAALALAAGLLARLAPRAARNVSDAAARHPLVAGSLGLLALVVVLVLVVVMAFTVVLIPVSLLAIALTVIAVGLGWFGLGAALGRGLSRATGRALPIEGATALGTLLVAAALAVLERVPFTWGVVPILVSAVGLGAVILTGFGVRPFVPAAFDDTDTPV
jgi:cytoskeletal protein CcmA (bactofilin family)